MHASTSLSIAELVIYIPFLLANIFVLIRHGLSRQSGWIFLPIFCTIRIVGASFGVSYERTGNVTDLVWCAVLGSAGISALLMSTAGLLRRVIDATSITVAREKGVGERTTAMKIITHLPVVGLLYRILASRATATSPRSRVIQLTQIFSLIALIICIVSGNDKTSSNPLDQRSGRTLLKAGIMIFVAVNVILSTLAIYTIAEISRCPGGEKRILLVVLMALPFIAVRIAYSAAVGFTRFGTFDSVDGSVEARAFMSSFEEFVVIIAYTVVGLMVPPKYKGADREITEKGTESNSDLQGYASFDQSRS